MLQFNGQITDTILALEIAADLGYLEVDALIGNTLAQAILLTILSKYGYFSVIYNQ